MAFCDLRLVGLLIFLCSLTFSTHARSWDLAVTIGKEVQFLANNRTIMARLKTNDAVDLGGVAYDHLTRLMYLSDTRNTNLTIFRKNLTAPKSSLEMESLHKRKNRTSIIGMVYDAATNSLYWTDVKEETVVGMAVPSNETTAGEPVILLKLPDKLPRGISLDACNRRLYWANSNTSNPSIQSSNLDGSDSTIVIGTNLYEPLGVTVDHLTGKLYWIDDEEGIYYKIERSNLDGSDRELLVHGRHQQPYYIAVDRENIYWTDWAYSAIWSIRKNATVGDLPIEWASFHETNRDADPKSIITRDNIDNISCKTMRALERANNYSNKPEFADQDEDVLQTSTEEVDSIDVTAFRCLNDGVYQVATGECHCQPGFDGPYCEMSKCHNYCHNQGECSIDTNGQALCNCNPSFRGLRCEENICSDYCLNDGQCSVNDGKPFCSCSNSRGSRCEQLFDIDQICTIFCTSGLVSLNTVDAIACRCANGTQILDEKSVYDAWSKTFVIIFSSLSGVLAIVVAILSYYVNKLRRRPRVKKRFVVSKNGITPLTARPQLPSDQCEIMIENCCNMNICETPCFEPKLRNSETTSHKKDEKNSLLDNMEGNSC